MATRIREKAKVRKETADKRPRATARYVRISSRKVKIVIDLIRGKQVDEALAILMYTPKAAAPVVGGHLLNIVLSFISRMVFIRYLAAAYLGVNGLFSDILGMLNLAELGIGSAMIFSMYKPAA